MIYLDNAATTRIRQEVLGEMLPYFDQYYGNASAVYSLGAKSRYAIDLARDRAAALISTRPERIFFTSGGSESDNWALIKTAEMLSHKGRHIITTQIEHPAVLNTARSLMERGFEVTFLPVDSEGFVSPEAVRDAIRDDTILVSVMTANNEIGTIEPVAEIGEVCHEAGVLFHTDAVQAFGQIPMDPDRMNIDLLSASAHKIYGPKGVGLLYIGPFASHIGALIHGGGQEKDKRSGTENVPGIVGFGKACELAAATIEKRMEAESALRDHLIGRILDEIEYSSLNGPSGDKRLPGNINISFKYIEAESLLILLDQNDIAASSGSACSAGSIEPSHVLLAIGRDEEEARESIRMTLSDKTTLEELDQTVEILKKNIDMLRSSNIFYQAAK
ncbi:MAG: cysteine desulfurase family protein [Lachnospiraceae bacterium]|nr:cysteine desulfurase family protein [Lachnospiraceae bacterium]